MIGYAVGVILLIVSAYMIYTEGMEQNMAIGIGVLGVVAIGFGYMSGTGGVRGSKEDPVDDEIEPLF